MTMLQIQKTCNSSRYIVLWTVHDLGGFFLKWEKPAALFPAMLVHALLFLGSLLALMVPWVLPLRWLAFHRCTFLLITGYPCPFCGVTRSFWAMAQGHWTAACLNGPLGVMVYGAMVFFCGINLLALLRRRIVLPGRIVQHPRALAVLLGVLVAVHWAYRLGHHLH